MSAAAPRDSLAAPAPGAPATVLHVITGLSTGGAETMLRKLVGGLDRDHYRSVVVSLMGADTPIGAELRALDVPVHALGMRRGMLSPRAVARLAACLRAVRPTVVQAWMYHANLAASLVATFAAPRTPVVWNVRHSVDSLADEKASTALVIRSGALLSGQPAAIVYNARVSRTQHEALGYSRRRGTVIANGFDIERFRPRRDARERLRAELRIGDDATVVGLVARYHPMKNHAGFLGAAARLARRRRDVHFLLAGPGVTGENEALGRMVAADPLAGRVTLLGERSDVPELMAALDVACLPSTHGEGFPNVVGEAMATGVPCVVADVGDAGWLVGDTGLVVPPRDADALAVALEQLVDAGPARRHNLGQAARGRVVNDFSLPRIVANYDELYRSLQK